ncbi:tyrosine-type recombinase/integrase [Paraglaciecola sp. 25GB23A]|uniref:tyrosine-type recombinase/integrase n=1 Tax=Paraglaciecola sp. 25GB23A TaxID=3156068 RepID=UPI0032AF0FD0
MVELSCSKIKGFHLVKTQKGSTWRLRYTNFAGKVRKLNLGKLIDGTTDRMKAVDLAVEYRAQIAKGIDPAAEIDASKLTFKNDAESKHSRLVKTYLEGPYTKHQAKKKDEGKHTIDMIKRAFADLMDKTMDELTKDDLKQWQTNYRKDAKGNVRAHTTINRSFSAFRTMIRHAVKHDVIKQDPTSNFSLEKESSQDKDKRLNGDDLATRRMFTKQELEGINLGVNLYREKLIQGRESSISHGKGHLPSFKDLAHPHWFFPFFRLAAYTGMRPGDLYTLNWQELNLQFKRLVKTPNKTRHHSNPNKVDIPLDDNITEVLKGWHRQSGSPVSGLVFPSPVNGRVMDKKAHVKHWKAVLELGQVKSNLDFYSLRHHYISKLVAGGIPLFTVAKLSGHKSIKMIEEHYGHLSPHAAAEALSLISGDFGQIADEKSGATK